MNLAGYVPKPKYKDLSVKYNASTDDIREALEDAVSIAKYQCAKIAPKFLASTEKQTARNIFNFLKNNVKYIKDGMEQNIKFPARLLNGENYGDCKSYSLFIACVLENLGIPYRFVYASYNPNNKTPQHVYIQTKSGIIIDPVWGKFNSEKKAYYKYFTDMNVNYLAGTGQYKSRARAYKRMGIGSPIIAPVMSALALNTAANVVANGITRVKAPLVSPPVNPMMPAPVPTTSRSVQPVVSSATPKPVVVNPMPTPSPAKTSGVVIVAPSPDATNPQKLERLEKIKRVVSKIIKDLEANPQARQWVAKAWGVDMLPVYKRLIADDVFYNDIKRSTWLNEISKRYFEVLAIEEEKKRDQSKTLFDKVIDAAEDTANKAINAVKEVGEVVINGVKYWVGWVPRQAFTGLVRANVFGLATDLHEWKAKDRYAVSAWWRKMGSADFSTLEQAINLGVKERRILGVGIGAVDPASITAEVASAAPVTASAGSALSAAGIKAAATKIISNPQTLASLASLAGKAVMPKETPTSPAPPQGTPATGLKPPAKGLSTTAMILIPAALVGGYMLLKKGNQ